MKGAGIEAVSMGTEWMERGACKQEDPEMFFPERGGSTRPAKEVCGRCAVKDQCLLYALDRKEGYGIWGGLSERERRRLTARAVVQAKIRGSYAAISDRDGNLRLA